MPSLYTICALLVLLIGVLYYICWSTSYPPLTDQPRDDYDFVVVGGGTAGSLIAARLSENPNFTVLLLEAGKSDMGVDMISIPMKNFGLYRSEYDWNYFTEPQKYACKALEGRRSYWSRAKVLGGCSSHNTLVYIRGHANDFNQWAQIDGCAGWSYAEVLPYFKKSERNLCKRVDMCSEPYAPYHGCTGEGQLGVSDSVWTRGVQLFLDAAGELGHRVLDDLNIPDNFGFGPVHLTVDNGVRASSSSAFLRPALSRSNLDVLVQTHVEKIVVEAGKARGILASRGGIRFTIRADKEIIVSAGTIGSAQLLMLSGIGPREHLDAIGVSPLVADLPVGNNLHDHVYFDYNYYINTTVVPLSAEMNSLWEATKYKLFKTGYWATNMVDACGFVNLVDKESATPEAQVCYVPSLFCGSTKSTNNICTNLFNVRADFVDLYYGPDNPDGYNQRHGITISTQLSKPLSRGSIRLRSSNPQDHPIIDPNYLYDSYDAKVLREGLKFLASFEKTKTFGRIGAQAKLHTVPHPTCGHLDLMSEEFLDCYVRHHTFTVYHPVGTCKMGPEIDPSSVVDIQLRVKGVEGLRVADASIFPRITSANTNAVVTMIGEKCADFIKTRWT